MNTKTTIGLLMLVCGLSLTPLVAADGACPPKNGAAQAHLQQHQAARQDGCKEKREALREQLADLRATHRQHCGCTGDHHANRPKAGSQTRGPGGQGHRAQKPVQAGKGKNQVHGNNGLGNGEDPQPKGNPKMNDGAGAGPGAPGARGGQGRGKK